MIQFCHYTQKCRKKVIIFPVIQTEDPISSMSTTGEALVTSVEETRTTTTEQIASVNDKSTTETETKHGIIILYYTLPVFGNKIPISS